MIFRDGAASQKGAPFTAKGRQNMKVGKVSAGHRATVALHAGYVGFKHSIHNFTATFL